MNCAKCKKLIEDAAYLELYPTIVAQEEGEPIVYMNPDQKDLYSTRIILHDSCYVSLLISLELCDLKHP